MATYQLYFLFFTQRITDKGKIFEPDSVTQLPEQGDNIYTLAQQSHLSCALQGDKRLFSIHAEYENRLDDSQLNQAILEAYQKISQYYQTDKANLSEQLLFAVSVVIADAAFMEDDDYFIHLPIDNSSHQATFKSDIPLMWLNRAEQSIILGEFSMDNNLPPALRHVAQWEIVFDGKQVSLAPLKSKEQESHPIIRFYALTWSSPACLEMVENWLLRNDAFLVNVFPTLLMTHWQFAHIFLIGQDIIEELDEQTSYYRNYEDDILKKSELSELRDTLQKMNELEAKTQYELSRTEQAIQTLENNYQGLAYQLNGYQSKFREQGWLPDWLLRTDNIQSLVKDADVYTVPKLLAQAQFYSRQLRNKSVYIEGLLRHLSGSKQRWLNQVAQKEHQTQLRLNRLVYGLTVLGTFITALQLFQNEGVVIDIRITLIILGLFLLFMSWNDHIYRFFNWLSSKFSGGKE